MGVSKAYDGTVWCGTLLTKRMENLPPTLAGMTVFAPGAEKAPSMPCKDSEGYLITCEKGRIGSAFVKSVPHAVHQHR
jgi:hypothetical protein